MKNMFIIVVLFISVQTFSQEITGKELLEKAIKFHDPNGNWETFKGKLFVTMETPKRPKRVSEINIDLVNQFFSVKATTGKNTSEYRINKDEIEIVFNGNNNPSEEVLKKNKLSKERATMYKNYYTYLYGLPMKLKDPGTIIHKQVNLDKFMGDNYYVLKVTYDEQVGKDVWYFYFDTKTYQMMYYQFYHDEEKLDGEYIALDGIEIIKGIKMPKNRAWYYNKNQQYLGTDILKSSN
jgi:hypothetical protein